MFKEEKCTRSNRIKILLEAISLNMHTTKLLVIKTHLLFHVSFLMVRSKYFEKWMNSLKMYLCAEGLDIAFKNKMSPAIDLHLNTQMRKGKNRPDLCQCIFKFLYISILPFAIWWHHFDVCLMRIIDRNFWWIW